MKCPNCSSKMKEIKHASDVKFHKIKGIRNLVAEKISQSTYECRKCEGVWFFRKGQKSHEIREPKYVPGARNLGSALIELEERCSPRLRLEDTY